MRIESKLREERRKAKQVQKRLKREQRRQAKREVNGIILNARGK
jgi:hypothetical protein